MNQAHIHLLFNHLPVFGSLIGGFVLIHGIFTKNKQTKMAAYIVFIVSAMGAGIVYYSGEGAEEAVEHIPLIAGNMIEEHEEFAIFALISFIGLGISSLIALFLSFKNSAFAKSMAFVTLAITLVSFVLVARTGYLGGQIRHTEIGNSSSNTVAPSDAEDDGD
jgi:uncharacterized membrane protein